jgi:hypothetical protein
MSLWRRGWGDQGHDLARLGGIAGPILYLEKKRVATGGQSASFPGQGLGRWVRSALDGGAIGAQRPGRHAASKILNIDCDPQCITTSGTEAYS